MIKAAAFDFDGVFVLDSDAVFKKDAWKIALASHAESLWRPLWTEGNKLYGSGKPGGRKEIFEYIFRGLGISNEAIARRVSEASQIFDDHVQVEIKKAGLVPGAREMLESFKARGVSCYLNSGTATSALICAAKNLGIADYFDGIYGSTKELGDDGVELPGGGKVENLERIEKAGFARNEIIVVGDGVSDFEAAEQFGCRFFGIANKWNRWSETMPNFDYTENLLMVSDTLFKSANDLKGDVLR